MPANQITVARGKFELPAGSWLPMKASRPEPREGRECAVEAELSPDFRMVYNHAHGIPACTARRFPLKGNYTTNHPFTSKEGHSVLLSLF